MKITRRQLRQIIKEAIDTDGDGTPDYRDTDSDNDGISDAEESMPSEDPRKMYERMTNLEKKYRSDWSLLKSIDYSKHAYLDDAAWEKLLALRDSTDDYGDFFNAVSRSFNRSTGRHEKTNEFYLMPSYARAVFDNRSGYPLSELKQAYEEFKELSPRFRSSDGTDMADSVYGRRRTNIIFIHNDGREEVISSRVNRKGSLGT